ncbi:MAG TPA: LamG-like jellyroll fold domain-containing protein, partial [Polyangiaceae bacterium]
LTHEPLPVAGTYVLRLTASDGALSSFDDVTIIAQDPPTTVCISEALNFDGANDWLNITDLSLSGDFTIEAWAKLAPGINEQDGIVGQESNAGPDLNFYAGQLRLYTGVDDAVVASTATTANVWTHYAVTRQSGALKLFINGAQNATGSWTGTFPVRAIGRSAAGFLGGQLDEVRIWNLARSAAQIAGSYQTKVAPTSSGLLAYYVFNEAPNDQSVLNAVGAVAGATLGANATAATDDPTRVAATAPVNFSTECGPQVNQAPQVNAGPDGTATIGVALSIDGSISDDGLPTPAAVTASWTLVSGPGTPSFAAGEQSSALTHVTLPVVGTYVLRLTASDGTLSNFDEVTIIAQEQAPAVCISEALNFDGVNDWLNISDLSLSGDFTIEAWAKLAPGIDQLDALVGQESNTAPDLNFYAGQLRLYTGTGDAVVASTATTANVWTHYAVTRQSGALKLFINGAQNATGNWTGTFPVRAIGRGAAGFLEGQLDEVRIWNVARSAAQIAGS